MVLAFSFCLYGPYNARYYPGMLENVYLAGKHFPAWKVYIYYAPDVEESLVNHLRACSNVVLIPTGITGPKNMIHRFFAIDEPGVELMMVRDADSRIHWKDRWAIREFVASRFLAHTIRDNVVHTARMMGGLWGLKKAAGITVQSEYASYVEDTSRGFRNAHDQNFLADVIYPKVLPTLLVHYSQAPVFDGERNVVRFPFAWTNDVYCGRIENDYIDFDQPPTRRTLFTLPSASLQLEMTPSAIPAPDTSHVSSFIPRPPEQPTLFLTRK
jgi:hypothetical protein